MQRLSALLFSVFFLAPSFLLAQASASSSLNIPLIMQGERFVGYSPQNLQWSDDNQTVYFSWNPEGDTLRSSYKADWATGQPEKLTLEEEKHLPESGIYSQDRTLKAFSRNGDLFLLEGGTKRQLTHTVATQRPVSFSLDNQHLIFRQDDNLFRMPLKSPEIVQLTQFKEGSKSKEKKEPEFRKWLEEDQEMFEILVERKQKEEIRKRRKKELEPKRPREIYLEKKQITSLSISPDENIVSYRLSKSPSSDRTIVPDYVTESGYTQDLNARAKVGSPQMTHASFIWNREQDTVLQLDPAQLTGIRKKPAFLEEYHEGEEPWEPEYEEAREVVFHGPVFSKGGRALLVARSIDNKDRWLVLLDPQTGDLKTLDHQRDEAWIGGPGISSWNFSTGNLGWFSDEQTIWFQSEASGYSHIYLLNVDSGEKRALTSGNFEVIEAELSQDESTFYISANAEGPHEHHFYHLGVEDGKMTRITRMKGGHQITLSPDQSRLAIRYSSSNSPWELYLMENRAGAETRQVTRSTTEAFDRYEWRKPEIVYFEAEDGVQVPARLYRPEGDLSGGPAVLFVHGAGYLQNVHEWWSNYYREYMFHNLLVDHGYTVLDIDYRASNGYGRDWRTGIYRHMGGKDLSDQIDGARYLVDELGLDPDRIGIYGGSYGGFITLMALFTAPGTFKAGAALRSVTDWAHYNHGYTANILNTPVEDPKAYRRSSPIYFADQLEDRLLILHGMIDTNVHFQDVVRLAQRLVELGKEDWEFAVFPLEGHGFREASSWADEYRRIFDLFQAELQGE